MQKRRATAAFQGVKTPETVKVDDLWLRKWAGAAGFCIVYHAKTLGYSGVLGGASPLQNTAISAGFYMIFHAKTWGNRHILGYFLVLF